MIFLDSNVPMYLVGSDHPHKETARRVLRRLVAAGDRLVTDVEVYQELVHRYRATNRLTPLQHAFDVLDDLVDTVFPVGYAHVVAAKDMVVARPGLSSRDALHVAIMQAEGVTRVFSFDRDFDLVPGVERFDR